MVISHSYVSLPEGSCSHDIPHPIQGLSLGPRPSPGFCRPTADSDPATNKPEDHRPPNSWRWPMGELIQKIFKILYIYICMYIHTYIYIYTYVYIYIRIYIYTYVYVCSYVCVYIYMIVYIYDCICVHKFSVF